MNPWIPHLLRAGGGGGGPVLPPAGRTMLANLTSSLILDEGTGGPTWSRATKAWGFNELGYLEELPSGCAFFGGARLVRNTVRTKSEDFSNAAWIKDGSVTVTGTNTIVCAAATSLQGIKQAGAATIVGQHYLYGIRVRKVAGGVDFIQLKSGSIGYGTDYVNVNLANGQSFSTGGVFSLVTEVIPGTYDIVLRAVSDASTANGEYFNIILIDDINSSGGASFTGDGVKSFELLRAWSVDVTNYDASYVPEYVSVGVVPSPFFGAGIDGAKYFSTDYTGGRALTNLIGFRREAAATNNLLHSRVLSNAIWAKPPDVSASELVVNGVFADASSWDNRSTGTGSLAISGGAATVVGTDSSNRGWVTQTKSTTVGKVYRVSCDYTAVSGTTFLVFGSATGTGVLAMSTTGAKFIDVVASATTMYIGAQTGGSGGNGVLDNISLKETAIQTTAITGLDGIANTATTLTAAAADAIILQPISLTSAARCASAYVKRRTGTGTISFTQDGTNWTDITSQINGSTWSRVQITSTLANPSVGFKISTSGDAIDVDCVQNEDGTVATSPIVTTTSTVTRNADTLTYQTASNIDFAVGTLYCEAQFASSSLVTRQAALIGADGLVYLNAGDANTSFKTYDGTTIVTKSGLSDISTAKRKRVISWGPTGLTVTGDGLAPTSGAFDGSFGSGAMIAIGTNANGYVGPVAIYNYQMTDAELQALTT